MALHIKERKKAQLNKICKCLTGNRIQSQSVLSSTHFIVESSLQSNNKALSLTSDIETALHIQCKVHREEKGKNKDKCETFHDILW